MKTEEKEYLKYLEEEFRSKSDNVLAKAQSEYLRNQFQFCGIKAKDRKELSKPFLLKANIPVKSDAFLMIKELWIKPQREFHYFAQELAYKYKNNIEKSDINLYEYLVLNNSWWDTVDFIAYKLIGEYFKVFPELRLQYVNKWLKSENIWLQRSAIIFQLKYKLELDTWLLEHVIESSLGTKEFFINKAIGWVLRDYSKVNPEWVINFVEKTNLSGLSRREALRLIKN